MDPIDWGAIVHVSIEADCEAAPIIMADNEVSYGCVGLAFTALAFWTKDVLPGCRCARASGFAEDAESSVRSVVRAH